MKNFFCICGFLFITNILLYGQTGGNTTLVGRWAAGPPYAFTVEDNIVYTASGGILLIIDISNPSNPELLGQVSTNGIISDVAKSDNYVYLAEGDSGLKIIDVSNLNSPVQVAELLLPGPVKKLKARNQILYVAEGEYYSGNQWVGGGLRTVNVSNPSNPEILGFYDSPDPPNYLTIIGQYVYIDQYIEYPKTFIVLVSNPAQPVPVGFFPHRFGNAILSGNLLYVATQSYEAEGLKIVDVTYPMYPTLVSQTIFPGGGRDIILKDNYAFLTNGQFWNGNRYVNGRTWSFDISNPNFPIELGFYESPGFVSAISIYNNTLLVSEGVYPAITDSEEGSGLRLLDVTNPAIFQPISFYDMPGVCTDVIVRDNYAFVSTLYGGISIVDVQDINNPIQIGYYNSPGTPMQVALQDNFAYLVELNRGLRIIDITDLNNPTEVGSYDTGATYSKIDVKGNYAFVLVGGAMKIFDITNPFDITEISSTDFGHTGTSLIVDGNFVYISVGLTSHWGATGWIKIYDVSFPEDPVLIGEYYAGGGIYEFVFYPLGMFLKDNYLYVISEYSGLRVFDVSDSTNPVVVSDTPTFGEEIEIYQNYAFISESLVGMNIFDISDPFNLELVETYNQFRRINGLTLDNQGKIFTASAEYGMMIFQNDLVTEVEINNELAPVHFSLKQNYPNPFNPSTKISYSLPSEGFVSLKVYDVLGNEIATLVNENKLSGNYETIFNGESLASGVYLYVLRYENQIYSKKMMLLK